MSLFDKRRKILPICLLFGIFAATVGAGPIVYQQPSGYVPPNGPALGSAGSSSTSASNHNTLDDFTLSVSAEIGAVEWFGIYRDNVTAGNNPVGPDTVSWDLAFFANSGGLAGTKLYDVNLPAASVSSTLLGTTTVGFPAAGTVVDVYQFIATFATPFDAAANTTYWFSPLSVQANSNPGFAWLMGTGGDGIFEQGGTTFSGDLAFSLVAVPEPNTFAILAAGLVLAGVRRLRKQAPVR